MQPVVGFALADIYQYMNPSASAGNANFTLGAGSTVEIDGSSNCQISMKPSGVTIRKVSVEMKLKSSMPTLRVITN